MIADQGREDVPPEVVGRVPGLIGVQGLHQDVGAEEVVAHGGQGQVGLAGDRLGAPGFLGEPGDAAILVHRQHPEGRGLGQGHRPGGHRDVRLLDLMVVDHLPDVHPVDVVRSEDGDVFRVGAADQVQVLVHGISRSPIPDSPSAHLGRHRDDEVVQEDAAELPPLLDVLHQGLGLELDQDVDAGVDEVAQDEVDDPVLAGKGNGRLGPLGREGPQTSPLAARQDDPQHPHALLPPVAEPHGAGSPRWCPAPSPERSPGLGSAPAWSYYRI